MPVPDFVPVVIFVPVLSVSSRVVVSVFLCSPSVSLSLSALVLLCTAVSGPVLVFVCVYVFVCISFCLRLLVCVSLSVPPPPLSLSLSLSLFQSLSVYLPLSLSVFTSAIICTNRILEALASTFSAYNLIKKQISTSVKKRDNCSTNTQCRIVTVVSKEMV